MDDPNAVPNGLVSSAMPFALPPQATQTSPLLASAAGVPPASPVSPLLQVASATPPSADDAAWQGILGKIRSGESPDYNTIVGGGKFSDMSAHPNVGVRQPDGSMSHAAGAYQFQPGTWAPIAKKLGLTDFSPKSQDAGAKYLAEQTYQAQTGRSIVEDWKKGAVDWGALGDKWTSLKKAGGSAGSSAADSSQALPSTSVSPSPSGLQITPEGMKGLMLMQALAPLYRFTPVNYDPFKVMPHQHNVGN